MSIYTNLQSCLFVKMLRNLVLYVLLEILLPQFIISKVYWTISSEHAGFSEDIILTCHLEDILKNPKDCTVRQWSGGPKGMGLVYNGYSSDKNKYEEYINPQSFQFSMIIRNITASDINVSYTCSCGFQSFTKNLTLDVNTFHYDRGKPRHLNEATTTVASHKGSTTTTSFSVVTLVAALIIPSAIIVIITVILIVRRFRYRDMTPVYT